ncbi:MAG TPA: HAD family hydrolase [Clostridiales bacterium]|nr:HAD family hydrolase [Clostridiales bacterium]
MKIKAVTVDFWDTIAPYPFTEEIFQERVEHSSRIFGKYDITFDTSEKLMRSIYDHFEDIWHNHRRTPTTPEMFRHIEKLTGVEFDENDFSELVSYNESLITKKYFDLRPEIADSIRKLSEKYKMIIISDTGFEPGRELRKALEKNDLLDRFCYGVFSDETGFSKPDERAFKLASEKAGCRTEQMVHIGDREDKDIIGARSSGMHSILFTGFRNDDSELTTADFTANSWREVTDLISRAADDAL